MATVDDCEAALRSLADTLAALDDDVRARHVPRRTAALTVEDLGVAFLGRLGPDGLTDLSRAEPEEVDGAQVRFRAHSDVVVEIGRRPASFPSAWLRGRVTVRAGWRDLLELRSLL